MLAAIVSKKYNSRHPVDGLMFFTVLELGFASNNHVLSALAQRPTKSIGFLHYAIHYVARFVAGQHPLTRACTFILSLVWAILTMLPDLLYLVLLTFSRVSSSYF